MKIIRILALGLIVLTMSCQKEQFDSLNSVEDSIKKKANVSTSLNTYSFDWENATYLPSKNNTNQLLLPWKSGTTSINPEYADDYKKYDGWELAYNTFNPDVFLNDVNYNYYFALYNKYRGVLRFYHWLPSSSVASTYVEHGLKLYGSYNSNILNYNAVERVSPVNQKSFSMIENQKLTYSGGTWYIFEYEMAYDPNIKNTSFPSFGLSSVPSWVNLSQININGTATGKIEGTIGNPGSSFNLTGLLQNGTATLMGNWANSLFLSIFTSSATGQAELTKTLTDGGKGIVKGIINGLLGLGGTGNTFQKVKLNLNTDIKLNGSITSSGSLFDMKFAIPGQSNSTSIFGVNYHKNLGIFSLANTPIITNVGDASTIVIKDDQYNEDEYHNITVNSLTIKQSSVNIVWNPDIINITPEGARIENLQMQIVNIYPTGQYSFGTTNSLDNLKAPIEVGRDCYFTGNLLIEKNGIQDLALSKPNSTDPFVLVRADSGFTTEDEFGIRFIFDVVPNNGAPKTKIIRTFQAKTGIGY
ncbi:MULTISPECIES: hypothetical protein [unclassified Sphingobacterium]|uniref:hypothetical protein n=1 Tax=unclassified Sphingobacterium TaxID=2609468 RepID=UPI0025FF9C0A|nr:MULTISPECIES: hypothetical protein [unclassified Sphingobacterium]